MTTETLEFKTELKQVLNIIIHSLYSHKEIFLRELISNASDAVDKARFESLTNPGILEDDSDWQIQIKIDKKEKTLTVSDNGIGMSRESIIENLGTIARSGTREFLETLQKAKSDDRPELIGQFGVGFYSSFMVANEVEVVSRMAKGEAVSWKSEGDGTYTVNEAKRDHRGTDIILHLKEEEFLDEWRIKELVKKFSDFIEHPVIMEKETLNTRKAIWLRPKDDIKDEEYKAFYKHLAHDQNDPAKIIHYFAEGTIEFKALLFVPGKRSMDLNWGEQKSSLHLYIKRVFISNQFETLLPVYLRFVKGVVDASDLPLNVSREILQENPLLHKIQSGLVTKILNTLKDMKEKEPDLYNKFYDELGGMLKEGIYSDFKNRESLADLLMFESNKTLAGSKTPLAEYVKKMPEEQKEIYYLIGENRAILEKSPFLEALQDRGWEVLFMMDPYDDVIMPSLAEYQGKKLKALDKGADMGESSIIEDVNEADYKDLLSSIKDLLGEVKEVRLTKRLKESAACLVSEEGALNKQMQEMMKRMGQEVPEEKRILEINPNHSVVRAMQSLYKENAVHPRIADYAWILYDQALLSEGTRPKDPGAFNKRINDLLERDALR
ncbi:MAG: molecular chaperone HtpG [Chlamydiota bacterium]|nr:molecular chaperone HtpG [Chlamydiota bacterium]